MVVMSSNDIMDVRKGELTKRYKLVEPLWKSVGFLKKKKKLKTELPQVPTVLWACTQRTLVLMSLWSQ